MSGRSKHDTHPGERRRLYDALHRHDPGYDGRLFIGVTSTGIYCRPVCPVQVPKLDNCTFHERPAVAEKAGFRPCLVCRPELAPGASGTGAVPVLARHALRRIEDGALNELSVDELAQEFGVSGRHLRRELTQAFGVSPIELAQTQRLLHAKQLLTETRLSITDVAFAAGFASLRRFNALFKNRYRLAPGALRRRSIPRPDGAASPGVAGALSFRVDYRPPFNWDAMLAFLAMRAIPGVELVTDNTYCRSVRIGAHTGWIAVRPWPNRRRQRPLHALSVAVSPSLQAVSVSVLMRVKALFDTRAAPVAIDRHLGRDPLLAPTIKRFRGMRVPGAFDGFELLLRAVLGQQVSVRGATTLAGRFAAAFGDAVETPWDGLDTGTPDAARIARVRVDRIARLGLPQKRAATIKAAARATVAGELQLAAGSDPAIACARLVALPGIGEWTANYVAMRALAAADALPAGDLGIKKALGLRHPKDIIRHAEAWRPYRAYGAMYAWLSLAGDGGG